MLDGGMTLLVLIAMALFKGRKKRPQKVSVVIPAYNEEKTVARVVRAAKECDLVNEVIVVDDGSEDRTAEEAEAAGAIVISHSVNRGKGEAMKTGLKHASGEIVAFVDADIKNIRPEMIEKMIRPVLEGEADLVKTKFKRKAGRVTLLTAKPLLRFFFPEIAHLEQPLSGQICARRKLLERVDFEPDYGVDIGIILDAVALGARIEEVDIGEIKHEMQPLERLHRMALQVVRTILDRAHKYGRVVLRWNVGKALNRVNLGVSLLALALATLFYTELPLASVLALGILGMGIALFSLAQLVYELLRVEGKKRRVLRPFLHMHASVIMSLSVVAVLVGAMFSSIQIAHDRVEVNPLPRKVVWGEREVKAEGPYVVQYGRELKMGRNVLKVLDLKPDDVLVYQRGEYRVESADRDNLLMIPTELARQLGIKPGNATDSEIRLAFRNITVKRKVEGPDVNIRVTAVLSATPDHAEALAVYVDGRKEAWIPVATRGGSVYVYVSGYGLIKLENRSIVYVSNREILLKLEDTDTETLLLAPAEPTPFAVIELKVPSVRAVVE
ncbi:glycosyltransferase [Methanopyrus sp. KOL6]|uniref:glycosyltransferase n=1 Tax=Methanopyrus sp. KOL6 TaxID=1937004 RepID=UPI000B4A6E49|nr:glycosyltransferase [Methanopyrus sp. KOL6]